MIQFMDDVAISLGFLLLKRSPRKIQLDGSIHLEALDCGDGERRRGAIQNGSSLQDGQDGCSVHWMSNPGTSSMMLIDAY
jgi:hypothetical protein